MADLPFAAATFEDQDAGSGPVHGSPSLGPMTGAIHNISSRHLHDISTGIPDDRQFLRAWRRNLQECLTHHNARLIKFLLLDGSGADLSQTDVMRRCTDVLSKYSKPTWNFASSTRELSLPASTEDTAAWFEAEIGVPPAVLRESLRKVIRTYVNAASGLFAAESKLEDKLKRLEAVTARVNDIMFLEPTTAMETMGDATRVYLESVFEKIDIETDYNEMVSQYKKFASLKGIVSLANFQKQTGPVCVICMTKEVSQVVSPCGHTFCDDCCRTQMTACYICRVQIRDKMRIYFS